MKKHLLFFSLMVVAIALFAFTGKFATGVKGAIAPAENAGSVWAISGTDSTKTQPSQGAFEFTELAPGTYKIVVEAQAPYKSAVKEDVVVEDGKVVDLGTIQLEQ